LNFRVSHPSWLQDRLKKENAKEFVGVDVLMKTKQKKINSEKNKINIDIEDMINDKKAKSPEDSSGLFDDNKLNFSGNNNIEKENINFKQSENNILKALNDKHKPSIFSSKVQNKNTIVNKYSKKNLSLFIQRRKEFVIRNPEEFYDDGFLYICFYIFL
jgi:hypothetical protein